MKLRADQIVVSVESIDLNAISARLQSNETPKEVKVLPLMKTNCLWEMGPTHFEDRRPRAPALQVALTWK